MVLLQDISGGNVHVWQLSMLIRLMEEKNTLSSDKLTL